MLRIAAYRMVYSPTKELPSHLGVCAKWPSFPSRESARKETVGSRWYLGTTIEVRLRPFREERPFGSF